MKILSGYEAKACSLIKLLINVIFNLLELWCVTIYIGAHNLCIPFSEKKLMSF